ncbi:MAG: sigma-70 family RNA polymerase sigma factor, partial [Actinobacteria bacterium]|nr:sigma-70 family RNA polymerase sigma factor [Actinomycetota bacterium]
MPRHRWWRGASVFTAMGFVLQRSSADDSELARRVSNGDGGAFATLDARHRSALQRYAGTLLRRSEHDAEDVVQDVLIRAHQALRAGDVPDELRPWLYRLTRNGAIDEVRRKRWGDESLDSDHAFTGDGREDPETVLRRKEAVRRLIEDLADLPIKQREALLARELDDQSPEQVAAQLGVSVMAAHKLTSRARENLIKTRDARDAGCLEIRGTLLDAHERGARPSEHAVRHVKGCGGCRAYQRDMRLLTKRLQALNPTLGLPILAGLVKLAGGGGTKTAAGAAAAIALAATGGIVVLDSGVHAPGEPAPFQLLSVRDSQGRKVTRGAPIPEGWTI